VDPRRLLPVLAALAAACVVATLVTTHARPDGERTVPTAPPSRSTGVPTWPAAVLADWDERRAAAWAEGDVDALRRLYADGSRTGAADVRLLRHYVARGLVVEDLATQVLGLDVVKRSSSRLVLVVTDRVVGGRAVGGGAARIALPADRASTRGIELVRRGGRWLVVEARDQASAAASTSRTSSSSKS
jgi:hypothetical protein